ncbi:hypothetical protein MPP7335_02370 [Mycolicibacterium parafortuitum]|uniref:Uncharacterized protein n=1 Tax=Mycolicibacterium parafortuitum TaxID=39692 RepID=A0A375YHN4_MYCPF|nr:hypothetical protein MPP7335_02370 [Mycolicibacterium parafortuitum]
MNGRCDVGRFTHTTQRRSSLEHPPPRIGVVTPACKTLVKLRSIDRSWPDGVDAYRWSQVDRCRADPSLQRRLRCRVGIDVSGCRMSVYRTHDHYGPVQFRQAFATARHQRVGSDHVHPHRFQKRVDRCLPRRSERLSSGIVHHDGYCMLFTNACGDVAYRLGIRHVDGDPFVHLGVFHAVKPDDEIAGASKAAAYCLAYAPCGPTNDDCRTQLAQVPLRGCRRPSG